jgi:hypothetical protein
MDGSYLISTAQGDQVVGGIKPVTNDGVEKLCSLGCGPNGHAKGEDQPAQLRSPLLKT